MQLWSGWYVNNPYVYNNYRVCIYFSFVFVVGPVLLWYIGCLKVEPFGHNVNKLHNVFLTKEE